MSDGTIAISDHNPAVAAPRHLIVNAGGQSRRMGQNKALLRLPSRDMPLVEHLIRRLLPLVTGQTVVVTNDPAVRAAVTHLPAVTCVADLYPDGGALGGIATGLHYLEGWCMVVACDMPLVDTTLFQQLGAWMDDAHDAILPQAAGQLEPFHSLIHARCLPTLQTRLTAQQLAVVAALMQTRWRAVDVAELGYDLPPLAFTNINTPAEWAAVCSLFA